MHRERCQAMARPSKHGGEMRLAFKNTGPERALLYRIEKQTEAAMRVPECARKSGPCVNFRCGPCGQSLGAPPLMKGRLQRAGGAFAGRQNMASFIQPLVNLHARPRLHACVIRCAAGPTASAAPEL